VHVLPCWVVVLCFHSVSSCLQKVIDEHHEKKKKGVRCYNPREERPRWVSLDSLYNRIVGYKRRAPDAPDTSDEDGSQPKRGKEAEAAGPKLDQDGRQNKKLRRDGEASKGGWAGG